MCAIHPLSVSLDRATGALYGLALGDAAGMPAQTLPRSEIRRRYGQITDLAAPYDDHPVSHGLRAGQVTDDTEQALLLAQRMLASPGRFEATAWAQDLLGWEADVKRRGLRDLLGPSTKAALSAIEAGGDPDAVAQHGTTNGAAMRICPVGIAVSTASLSALVDAVEVTCRVTHNTGEAIAAAAAVAAAISAQIDGSSADAAQEIAMHAATAGQARGYANGVPDMSERIAHALERADARISHDALADEIGNSVASHQSIPAAFAIARRARGDAWQAALIAANFGDDTDTIGAIAGAICGAGSGAQALPSDKIARLNAENDLPMQPLAERLLAMRVAEMTTAREAAGQ